MRNKVIKLKYIRTYNRQAIAMPDVAIILHKVLNDIEKTCSGQGST